MSLSSIASVTFDKPVYVPGETITMTVTGSWASVDQVTVTTADGASGTGTVPVVQIVSASDTGGRNWTPVSNDGSTAVFTAAA